MNETDVESIELKIIKQRIDRLSPGEKRELIEYLSESLDASRSSDSKNRDSPIDEDSH